jgi:2-polyprenyl-3-methyl-5-hydroxy-6-metoxy-1,4-benzoquinol methylase
MLHMCPVCRNNREKYVFTFENYQVYQCNNCGAKFLNPQPSEKTLGEIYNANYFLIGNAPKELQARYEMKSATAQLYLKNLKAYTRKTGGKLLEVGCGQGEFLYEAELMGFEVTGIEYSSHAAEIAQRRLKQGNVLVGDLETVQLTHHQFDVVVNTDVIEHTRDPQEFMKMIHHLLKPGGTLFLVTISLDSWTAKLMRKYWMEYKIEHLTYFSRRSLQTLATHTGFELLKFDPVYKMLSPKYILAHFERYPVPLVTPLLKFGYKLLPHKLKTQYLRLGGSGITMLARTKE